MLLEASTLQENALFHLVAVLMHYIPDLDSAIVEVRWPVTKGTKWVMG